DDSPASHTVGNGNECSRSFLRHEHGCISTKTHLMDFSPHTSASSVQVLPAVPRASASAVERAERRAGVSTYGFFPQTTVSLRNMPCAESFRSGTSFDL